MKRLMLYFSYIGTNYRGLQRTIASTPGRSPDLESVQGVLEFGLKKILHSPTPLTLFTSSRTDVGVHAVESTVQIDLTDELSHGKGGYSPERMCQSLNLFLEKNECDIRVKRIVEVPKDFSCRRASSRVYEYRLAVFNEFPHNVSSTEFLRLLSATNIRDLNRCEAILQPFDLSSAQDASKLFLGQWDFSTFMKSTRGVELVKRTKTILRFSISPEVFPDPDELWDPFCRSLSPKPYDIYTFTVEGSGFLRRQVRRMVGALVGVGTGLIGPKDILWMLKNPSEQNWNGKVATLGPNGLYLKKINYSNLNILRGYLS